MKQSIINIAKEKFLKILVGPNPYNLDKHITELERWSEKICNLFPDLDREAMFLTVYLHDIGHYPINPNEDHAVTSERIAKVFLEENNYPSDKTLNVLHAIRAHRCKDVLPQTGEAKAFAFIDSASHLTDRVYFNMLKDGLGNEALNKLDRDFRDLEIFSQIKMELEPLYLSWKSLLKNLIKLGLDKTL